MQLTCPDGDDHTLEVQEPGVSIRIRAELPGLRPAERRVAEAVLANPVAVADTPITTMARRSGTSETTVLRFCRSIGMSGYPELRMSLARETTLAERDHPGAAALAAEIDLHDSLADIMAKVVYTDARAVEETAQTLDVEHLQRAVTSVTKARRVDIVGVGASGFVGMDLQQKLHRIGRVAFAWVDTHAALTSAALLEPDDVIIGISHTGTTIDIVEPMQLGKSVGATTVAITNVPGSPVAEVADAVLLTAARETRFRSGAMASRIAQLAVVDCLFVGVAQRTPNVTDSLEKTYHSVRNRRLPHRGRA